MKIESKSVSGKEDELSLMMMIIIITIAHRMMEKRAKEVAKWLGTKKQERKSEREKVQNRGRRKKLLERDNNTANKLDGWDNPRKGERRLTRKNESGQRRKMKRKHR